jgi:2-phosphosulfolactate phosphatase
MIGGMRSRFAGISELDHAPSVAVAVVVDVMRAFTVAAWAFERGADKIVLAADLAEGVRRGYLGVHRDDVRLCFELDRFAFAMVAEREDGLTVLRRCFSGP